MQGRGLRTIVAEVVAISARTVEFLTGRAASYIKFYFPRRPPQESKINQQQRWEHLSAKIARKEVKIRPQKLQPRTRHARGPPCLTQALEKCRWTGLHEQKLSIISIWQWFAQKQQNVDKRGVWRTLWTRKTRKIDWNRSQKIRKKVALDSVAANYQEENRGWHMREDLSGDGRGIGDGERSAMFEDK